MKTAGRTMTLPLLACSVVWTGNHAAKGEIKVEIGDGVLEQAERSRPAEVFVYEVLPADPGLWMERMTRVVGIRGESEDTKAQLTLAEGSRHLEVRKISSATFYGEMDMLWKEEPTPEKTRFKVPSDQESREIALTWLGKFGFADGNLKNVMISIEDELFELTTPDNRDRPKKVVVGKNVEVRRRVDGLPVYGPGSKIKLYIGEGGNVRGFTAVWRQLDPSSSVLGHKASRGERRGRTVRPVSAREAFDVLRKDPLNRIPQNHDRSGRARLLRPLGRRAAKVSAARVRIPRCRLHADTGR